MTVIATWDGVPIEPVSMPDRGYLAPITVRGVSMPRYFGYMQAAIYEVGNVVAAPATGYVATSTSSVLIGVGDKSFTTQAGKLFTAGQYVVAYVSAQPGVFVVGVVQSYDPATGALVMSVSGTGGTGTFATWTITLSGPQGATGVAGSGTTLHVADDGIQITAAARPQINFQHSIVPADNPGNSRVDVALSGDTATPGGSKFYGTDTSGNRGWQGQATTSVPGIVELAMNAEVVAGTDAQRAVTPAGVAAAIQSQAYGYTDSQLTIPQQDIRALALMVSELRGDRLNMVDGIADPFSDQTDVASATNATYNVTSKLYSPTDASTAGVTAQGVSVSGGDEATHPKANAFDSASTEWWSSAVSSGTGSLKNVAWIGRDFGAGNEKNIRSITVTNGAGFGAYASSWDVQCSDDLVTWASAAINLPGVSATSAPFTLTVPTPVGPRRAWRITPSSTSPSPSSGNRLTVAEVVLTEATLGNITLQSAPFASDVLSPSTARLCVQCSSTWIATNLNTDVGGAVSRDGGTTWTPVTLAYVEAQADGTKTYEGQANIGGQPAGSSMVYKITTANNHYVAISGVVFQWRP